MLSPLMPFSFRIKIPLDYLLYKRGWDNGMSFLIFKIEAAASIMVEKSVSTE